VGRRRRLDPLRLDQPVLRRRAPAQLRLALLRGPRTPARLRDGRPGLRAGLYRDGTATPPAFAYRFGQAVIPGDGCPVGGTAVSGLPSPTRPARTHPSTTGRCSGPTTRAAASS
jgi:hypothetical protein